MNYAARFEKIDGNLFRFDTRVYLGDADLENMGVCIGTIIGKNPGSASPSVIGELAPLELDGDKLLPYVRNRFLSAFKKLGKSPPSNSFVRVWNLFYLCNKDLKEAKLVYEKHNTTVFCPTESEQSPLVWFAWGPSDSYLNPFKERFLSKDYNNSFFYNNKIKTINNAAPSIVDSAKHTQGMPSLPVEEYLEHLL